MEKRITGYKLIKQYPQCPRGRVLRKDIHGQFVSRYVEIVDEDELKNYPEFWEPIYEDVLVIKGDIGKIGERRRLEKLICEALPLPDLSLEGISASSYNCEPVLTIPRYVEIPKIGVPKPEYFIQSNRFGRKIFHSDNVEFLTSNNMEKKKIIGYKLKDEKLKDAVDAIVGFHKIGMEWERENMFFECFTGLKNLKVAGVLDLWFEPVYEEEERFEVGDLVVCLGNHSFTEAGEVVKIKQITNGVIHYSCKKDSRDFNLISNFRKATAEEIKKYTGYYTRDWVFITNKYHRPSKGVSVPALVRYSESDRTYGFNLAGEWTDSFNPTNTGSIVDRKATQEELDTAFAKEAEKRGFKHDSYINDIDGDYEQVDTTKPNFNAKYCWFELGNAVVFKDGKWAEPIGLPEIAGYEGEDKGNYIEYGCTQVPKSLIQGMSDLGVVSFKKQVDGKTIKISKAQTKQLFDYVNKK